MSDLPTGGKLDRIRRISPIRLIRRSFCLLFCVLVFTATASAQPYDPLVGPTSGAKIINKPDAQIPLDLQFADEAGQPVKLGDYFHPNRPVVVVMVYFGCPFLCGETLNGLTEVLRKVKLQPGREFEIVTVSFDPKEGPGLAAAKKANFVKLLGNPEAAAGWHFLTNSDPAAAHVLGDAIGFGFRLNPQTGNYVHETGIYICTPEGRVSRVERGSKYDPEVLHDSLLNASQGKISSGLFGVALACGLMTFDAATGKYTWAAMAVMRVTGILTFIFLASGIGWMLYRESRQKLTKEVRAVRAEG
jgi:protein SCO1